MADLEALLHAWLATKRSANTRAAYLIDVRRYFEWRATTDAAALVDLDRQLARFRDHALAGGASPATTARRLSAIVSFARFVASAQGAPPPVPEVRRPEVAPTSATAALGDDEATRLVAAADEVGAKAGALLRLLMLDGVRVGELLAAGASDAAGTPPAMALRVQRSGRSHSVALHPETAHTLACYLAGRRAGPLLLGSGEQGLTRFGVDYLIKRAGAVAHIQQNVTANALRRRYVLVAQGQGAGLEEIQQRLGHADRRTTKRYLVTRSVAVTGGSGG